MKLGSLVAFLFVIGLAFSSFTSVEAEPPNNGVIVEVVKGEVWAWGACGYWVYTDKTTRVVKDGVSHLTSLQFDLPEGHCMIPAQKATKFYLGLNDEWRVVITPSGQMTARRLYN